MKETILKKLACRSKDGVPGEIEYGLEYLEGNADSYFTVTAWFDGYDRDHHKQEFGGACHEEILAVRPSLKPFVALHLADSNGVPMHAEANGWYWLAGAMGGLCEQYHGGTADVQHWKPNGDFDRYGKSTPAECLAIFAKHLRLTLEEAEQIKITIAKVIAHQHPESVGYSKSCAKARKVFAAIVESLKPRWKAEADAAIAQLKGADKPPKEYQPKTGEKCSCRPGTQRDNCPDCEGTGWRIDFAKIRNHARSELNAAKAEHYEGER